MLGAVCAFSQLAAQPVDTILFKGQHVELLLPEHGLASGSVKIESRYPGRHFADWTRTEDTEVYGLIQKVARLWKRQGIDNYLVIGKENIAGAGSFDWEVVPYQTAGWRFWKQLQVIWLVFIGSRSVSSEERQQLMEEYATAQPFLAGPLMAADEAEVSMAGDAFCRTAVIEKQQVIDQPAMSVRVLYDYKPLAKNHFLIVTKQHAEKFSEVSLKAYLEASAYARQLLKKYGREGNVAYLYHKTGKEAGQTVPHWHMHVVIADSNSSLYNFAMVVYNTLKGFLPIQSDELRQRVDTIRQELGEDCLVDMSRSHSDLQPPRMASAAA